VERDHRRGSSTGRGLLRSRRVLLLLIASFLVLALAGATFDVSITHWDGKRYPVELSGGDALLGWPNREIVITPRPAAGVTITPLFAARRRAGSWIIRPSTQDPGMENGAATLRFRMEDGNGRTRGETHLRLLLPVPVRVDADGLIVTPAVLRGYPLGHFPESPPVRQRARAKALAEQLYVISETDSARHIAPFFTIGGFLSKIRPRHTWTGRVHPLALDYGIVDLISRINRIWNRAGYAGRVRIESPFRTPDYNDADAAGRATFSFHLYGSACDIILSLDDDKLHDDVNRDGRRDPDDIIPLARLVRQSMAVGATGRSPLLPKGGIGVYRYLYRDGRPEEFMMHVDLRGRIAGWGEFYDSDTVRPASRIDW
jgi:hypothetical protein